MGTVAVGAISGTAAADHANTTDDRIQIVDAYEGENGEIVVAVQATTTEPVSDLQFLVDNGTEAGPLSLDNGGVVNALYDDTSNFQSGDSFDSTTGNHGMVNFALNQSWENGNFIVNASAEGASYDVADSANRSVLTANAYSISLVNASGGSVTSSTPVAVSNESSGTLRTYAFVRGGGTYFHCGGVLNGSTCEDPDTDGQSHTYERTVTQFEGPTALPAALSVRAFNLRTGNGSTQTTVNGDETLTLTEPTAPVEFLVTKHSGGLLSDISELRVETRDGTVVQRRVDGVSPFLGPLFISPKTDYTVVIERPNGTERRPLTVPTKGFTRQLIQVNSDSMPTSTVLGLVVNESNEPVSNVTVTAEPAGSSSDPPAVNSTTTADNGLFTMQLPETDVSGTRYQFQLASSQTDNGTLTYFPTRADGQRNGYKVREDRTIVGRLQIRQGGEVDINVTNATGGPIASPRALTSLSQTTTATTDRTRQSLVEGFNLLSFDPNTAIDSAVIRVPSPTTGPQQDVSYNVWGTGAELRGGIDELCARQVGVSQGDRSTSDCELEAGGTLNISLTQYGSLIEQSDTRPVEVGTSGYYIENELIVRNADSGNVTSYIGSGSFQQFLLRDSDEYTLSLPVPAGNYTVELRPTQRWVDRTSVRNRTAVSVPENGTGSAVLKSGSNFVIDPDLERTNTTLRRTADNTVALDVYDPATGTELDGSQVNVTLRLLHRNGTVASETESLSYQNGTFVTETFTPAVSAGEYGVSLRVTYDDGTSSYNTTVRDPVQVSDFSTNIQTERQAVEPNEPFQAGLRAYNQTADPVEPIDADADNITLTLYDQDGNLIERGTADSPVTNGSGTIEVPGLPDTGVYRIGVSVQTDDGRQGVDDTWIRVSGYDIDVALDKSVYRPDETVNATVTVTDGATGDPVDAELETRVGFEFENGSTSLSNSTGSDGRTVVELDPETLFNGSWEDSTFMEVEATIQTDSGLSRIRAGEGIDVRPFQTDVSAAQSQFENGQSPVIGVAVPPGTNIASVNATRINGKQIDVAGTKQDDGFYRVTLDSDLTNYSVDPQGEYRVQVEVTSSSGATATDRARFEVSSLNVRAEPTARSYTPGENITVGAEVRYQNGSTASGEPVTVELYEKASPPIKVDTNNSQQTDSDGRISAELSPDSTGIHGVRVSAGGSEAFFPVLVNDIETNFTDENGDPVDSYEFTPGQSGATVNISATNGTGAGIDGQMLVRALVDGERIELGSGAVTGGTGGISFSIPESANTGTVPIEVIVRSNAGVFDSTTGTIELTAGSDTLSLDTDVRETVYAPGDSPRVRAEVTKGDQPANETVAFTLLSESTERSLGTATTGADGTVSTDVDIPTDLTDGEYRVRATVVDSGITAYDGIYLSDMDLAIDTNESAYAAGDTIRVNLSATADGTPVSDAEAGVRVRLADGSTVTKSVDRTGEVPYEVTIELPEDDDVIGTRTVGSYVRNGSSVATASTTVEVFNASEDANLSVPETIIANETNFTVAANATVDTAGQLTVFSPGTASVTHEEELDLNATTELSISAPGTYVFSLSVPGVGTETVVRNVDTGPNDPTVRVGPDLTTNATEFADGDDVYIRTEADDMTAEVFSPDDSFTVSLNREDGATNYGVLSSAETSSGPYLVRLDGPNSTDVDSVLIEVSS